MIIEPFSRFHCNFTNYAGICQPPGVGRGRCGKVAMQLELRPLFIGRTSPAFGRPTPIQPFPNPDMDGINRHATTNQPSFGSNTRTTRFRLNHPASMILQTKPLSNLIPTSTKKTGARSSVQSPLQAKCRASSTQRSRSRVTFVILPATPWPVPSKNRQRFIPSIHHSRPSNFETGIIASKYPSAAATGDRCP